MMDHLDHPIVTEHVQHLAGKDAGYPGSTGGIIMEVSKSSSSSKIKKAKVLVKNVHELRSALLDQNHALEDIEFDTPLVKLSPSGTKNIAPPLPQTPPNAPISHEVLQLIATRAQTSSRPSNRHSTDTAHLSLFIEGGGMRGAVSAGMAAAIAVLGLTNTFDSIYGSSAGSVVGAYMVSRQMCVDVYTEVLTAAKTKFVSKGRLLGYIARGMLDSAVNETGLFASGGLAPAMNISYVLDGIMDGGKGGLRPLDMGCFEGNDAVQPLRIVASTVREGSMEVSCLGSKEMDFFSKAVDESGSKEQYHRATRNVDGKREGLFACLQTSMTVPAACGPPLHLIRNQDAEKNITSCCFDAFCFEPIPYRSAVEEGATHVLALRTRPHGVSIPTKPGFFEKTVAPNYFESHNMPKVSKFFEKGGQQYLYAEDYLTLHEGLTAGKEGTLIPPPKLLYGVEEDDVSPADKDRSNWKRAHLLPVVVPEGNTEHPVLSVDRDEVLHAVRQGFATAFDLLAPAAGIELEEHLTGERVAELVFSTHGGPAKDVLEQQILFAGDTAAAESHAVNDDTGTLQQQQQQQQRSDELREDLVNAQWDKMRMYQTMEQLSMMHDEQESADIMEDALQKLEDATDAIELLKMMPGFQSGKLECLSQGLHDQIKR